MDKFNNKLAILLLLIIACLWFVAGKEFIKLDDQVSGALIVTWTLIIQYYFRRKPEAK